MKVLALNCSTVAQFDQLLASYCQEAEETQATAAAAVSAPADASKGQLLGTATLIIEKKFIHSCGKVMCQGPLS
jgi:hypothetical protein